MRSKFAVLSAAVLALSFATAHAQDATHGKATFDAKCGLCHNADSTEKKIGPGLKGMYARGTMADGTKVTDASVMDRINNGKAPMPPFKGQLTDDEMKGLIAYLKTL